MCLFALLTSRWKRNQMRQANKKKHDTEDDSKLTSITPEVAKEPRENNAIERPQEKTA